jgi:vacuolar-type H+-ATPase subunit F/Vma7
VLLIDWGVSFPLKTKGMKKTWVVKDRVEAKKTLETLIIDPKIALILTSNQVFEWVKPIVSKRLKNRKRPLIVGLAEKKEPWEQAVILAEIKKRIVD